MGHINVCEKCGRAFAWPCNPTNDNWPKDSVVVACDSQLQRKSHEQRLGIVYVNIKLSRRRIPDFVNNVICDHLNEGRKIYWADGREFIYQDEAIEDAFDNELSFSWISQWLKRSQSGGPRQIPQARTLERRRLMDLAIRIRYPLIARHIAK